MNQSQTHIANITVTYACAARNAERTPMHSSQETAPRRVRRVPHRFGPIAAEAVAAGLVSMANLVALGGADCGGSLIFAVNGVVTVGIDRTKGGAITWLSWTGHPGNVVNHHDPGRLIQQSYYAGRSLDRRAEGQHAAWSPWAWNPIQGGGVRSWARVTNLQCQESGTLFCETIPKLWDMPDEEAAAIMRQWTGFEKDLPNVVVVRREFIAKRQENDRWGPSRPCPQEVPACYFIRSFSRFRTYLGDGAWQDEAPRLGPPWSRTKPPRSAMAVYDPTGRGIAVFSPAGDRHWNFGPHGPANRTEPMDPPCVHIAPITVVPMGPRSAFRYRFWLVVGDVGQISVALDQLWRKYGQERGEFIATATE